MKLVRHEQRAKEAGMTVKQWECYEHITECDSRGIDADVARKMFDSRVVNKLLREKKIREKRIKGEGPKLFVVGVKPVGDKAPKKIRRSFKVDPRDERPNPNSYQVSRQMPVFAEKGTEMVCLCGCGETVIDPRQFKTGHDARFKNQLNRYVYGVEDGRPEFLDTVPKERIVHYLTHAPWFNTAHISEIFDDDANVDNL